MRSSDWSSDVCSSDLHHAVVDEHRIALRTDAEAARRQVEFHADRLGELARAVSQHLDLVAGILLLAPGPHDKGVVDRQAGHLVDTLRLQVAELLDEARQMLGRTGDRKSTRLNSSH